MVQLTGKSPEEHSEKRARRRRRRIRAISVFPALLTLGNLMCGFAAIHFASRPDSLPPGVFPVRHFTSAAFACYLIFVAMIFDALDGRVARLSRTSSDFGGQLDSLADVVSFGLAPAFIAIRMVMRLEGHTFVSPLAENIFDRFCWVAACAYIACTALRLARFNVENSPDETSHLHFKGLPSPGAAGAMVGFMLLYERVLDYVQSTEKLSFVIEAVIPAMLVILGLLMVSRINYQHLTNRYLRGKKPFGMLVLMVLGVLVFILHRRIALAIAFGGYALSGPVGWIFARKRKHVKADIQESP